MSDNVNYPSPTAPPAGSVLEPIGVDECTVNGIAGVGVPLGKVGFGDHGIWTYVSATVGLPVSVVGTVPVSGTVAVSNLPATQPVSGSVSVANLPATQPVSGTVAISGTVPVSLASVPSHPVTNAGTFAVQASQSGTWNVGTVAAVTAIANALPAGSNVLGRVGIDQTTPGTTNLVQVGGSLPAGSNTLGVAIAPDQTGALYSGTTALTPKFAAINASASGDNTVVAAVGGKKLRVLRYSLSANGGVNAQWKSATAGAVTGPEYLTQYARGGGAYCPLGLFETAIGEALVLNLSAATPVGGVLTYVEV